MVDTNKYLIFFKLMPILLMLSIVSCAHVISKQIREQVKPDITSREVLKDPERYRGQIIILSGVIVETENTKEGTLLKVLQRPEGFRGKPKDVDETEGRFLAIYNGYLDANIYAKGRSVIIAGEVQGKRILPLGEIEYTYPVIYVKEIYLWPEEKRYYSPYPSWHIGFGYFY